MEEIIVSGYSFKIGDILTAGGTIITAALALAAVFINHFFASRRLTKQLRSQEEQLQTDIESRQKQIQFELSMSNEKDKLEQYLKQMERLFTFVLELRLLVEAIKKKARNIEDIKTLKDFLNNSESYEQKLELIDQKIRVVSNVYLSEVILEIIFIANFQLNLGSKIASFPLLQLSELHDSPKEQQERLELEVEELMENINECEEGIQEFERYLVDEIESKREKGA